MFRPLELFIGLRYIFRARRRNHFISFISLVSILGMTLGVVALITVLSVMNGFQKELRERILSMTAHATILGMEGQLQDWASVAEVAQGHPRVQGSAPFIRAEAMVTHAGRVSGAMLRGILPDREGQVSQVGEKMIVGRLQDLEQVAYGIVLGSELARYLGVGVGDKVTVITPQASVTPVGVVPRLRRFTVVGLFEVGMYQYDRNLALMNLPDAARLFRLGDGVTGLRLDLDDMFQAPRVVRDVAVELGGGFLITDWTREHANFFRAVQIEKTAMFVILMLIVAVAAFNIVSTLVMVVTDKRGDIAILRTLGSTPLSIMGVFIVQGLAIGLVGTLLGALLGVWLAVNVADVVAFIEGLLGFKFLAPDVYYISDLPSELRWRDVALISGCSFAVSLLATIYPAWRAARTRPAEALSYE